MKNKLLKSFRPVWLALVAGLLGVNTLNAATFQPGYVLGGLGSAFIDTAAAGGNDSSTASDLGFVVQSTNLWQIGQQIKITGIALPIRGGTAGTWTVQFYDLNNGASASSFDGKATETLVGSAQAIMPTPSIAPWSVVFDTPIIFTAHSTGIAVRFTNASPGTVQVKLQASGFPNQVRLNATTGAVITSNPQMRFTIAGSVILPPAAGSLVWQGNYSGDWDTVTTNWNLALGNYASTPTNYTDNGTFGPQVIFDDTLVSPYYTNINLTTGTPLRPSSLILANSSFGYNFSGSGKITGATILTNNGTAAVTLNTANDFTGGSVLNSGRIRLGNVGGLGTGPITLANGGVSSVGSTPLNVTNSVVFSGGTVLGDPTDNGVLTFSGTQDFNGTTRTLNIQSDVILSGVLTNGGIGAKSGPGTLFLTGQDVSTNGTWKVLAGVMQVSGTPGLGSITSFTVGASAANGVAKLIITNGASVTINQSLALNYAFGPQVGAQGQSSLTSSNYLILAGSLGYATNVSGPIGLGNYSAYDELDMYPGSRLRVGGFLYQGAANNGISVFNLNGGTIAASSSNPNFLTGQTAVNILGGGVTFDTESNSITVAQPLLAGGGGGGLTVQGAGTLWLTGANTYTGPTVVQAGTLGLYPGTVIPTGGSVTVDNAATVAVNMTGASSDSEVSSLSLNGSTVSVQYGDLANSAPSSAPAISYNGGVGTMLNLTGVNAITLTGINFGVGSYPILQFAAITGGGSIVMNAPSYLIGTLTTNGNTLVYNVTAVNANLLAQPVSQRVLTNTTATFSVVASGDPAPNYYQWYEIVGGVTNLLGGANSASYTTAPVQDSDTGDGFFVVVSNGVSGVTSATAILTAGHNVIVSGKLHSDVYNANTIVYYALNTQLYPNSTWPATNTPTVSANLSVFDDNQNLPNNGTEHIYGYFTPPTSGDYVFFLASDDAASLWLSTDTSAANAYEIAQNQANMAAHDWTLTTTTGSASETNYSSSGEWRSDLFIQNGGPSAYANNIAGWSAYPGFNTGDSGIPLVAGNHYYIEMDHYQATGGQNASVTYKLAGNADPVSGSASLLTGNTIALPLFDTQALISHPAITGIRAAGANVIISGTNTLVNYAYNVLSTTNLVLPLSSWSVVNSGYSDNNGNFTSTNAVSGSSQRFYRLQSQ